VGGEKTIIIAAVVGRRERKAASRPWNIKKRRREDNVMEAPNTRRTKPQEGT